jgi:MoxR-like ATPase
VSAREQIADLQSRIGRSIVGQEDMIERLLIGLIANGNLLVEGLPGLAKTRAVKALARNLDADFSRVQFTPDLLPSDVTGTEVYHTAGGTGEFRFEPGPIFANIVLADEINRAPAKVQSSLLEAMEERQVTVGKTTHALPPLFMVMATQNPIEQEGTYPLPEAQMDRFLMHVRVDYPAESEEADIVRLVRSEEVASQDDSARGGGDSSLPDASTSGASTADASTPDAPISQQAVFDARADLTSVHVSDAIEKYIVDLVFASRYPDRYSDDLASWIDIGASPRGSIGLDKASRVHAWLKGQDHVTPDNVRSVVHDVFRHRMKLTYEANAARISADTVIDELVKLVAVA